MNNLNKTLLAFLLATSLASCTSTGGAFANLVPMPKFLDGEVSKTTYTAPGGAFKVGLPYSKGSYEWKYAEVTELKDGPVIGVVFGPAALDRNYYHAVLIGLAPSEDPSEYVNELFARKVAARGGTFTELSRSEVLTNGNRTYYAAYESDKGFLALSVTALDGSFYVVEADVLKIFEDSAATEREAIKTPEWEPFGSMLKSFQVK